MLQEKYTLKRFDTFCILGSIYNLEYDKDYIVYDREFAHIMALEINLN